MEISLELFLIMILATQKKREENIKRIIYGAYLLENENIITIVCNISPFQKLRNSADLNSKII